MTKVSLEESMLIKRISERITALDKKETEIDTKVAETLEQIKKDIEEFKNQRNLKFEIINAYNSLRLDAIMGIAKVSVSKLRELKGYMANIDFDNIPKEIKKYMEGEK